VVESEMICDNACGTIRAETGMKSLLGEYTLNDIYIADKDFDLHSIGRRKP
jgi:hypothetical protein